MQAKIESDRLIVSVGKRPPQETGIKVRNHSSALSLAQRCDFQQLLQGVSGEAPLRLVDFNLKEFAGFQVALLNKVPDSPQNRTENRTADQLQSSILNKS